MQEGHRMGKGRVTEPDPQGLRAPKVFRLRKAQVGVLDELF